MASYLVSADVIRERMSLPDIQDITDSIEGFMLSAQLYIQSILETELSPADREDKFKIPAGAVTSLGGDTVLRLKQSFVEEDSVTIVLSSGGVSETLSTEDFYVDLIRGLVYIHFELLEGDEITVTYSAGVTSTTAPAWLSEAVIVYVTKMLGDAQGNDAEGAAPKKGQIDKRTSASIYSLLEPYLRGRAFQIRPRYGN